MNPGPTPYRRPKSPVRRAQTSSGHPAEAGLARQLGDLAREFQREKDPEELLRDITRAAVDLIPSAEWAGVTLLRNTEHRTRGATDPHVSDVDRAQYGFDEGPCLDSARRETTVRTDDLRDEHRWPRFAPAAADIGVLSMASVELFVEGDSFGALNLYSTEPDAFDDADESTALVLASHAAIALAARDEVQQLREALDVRDLVGQAKGILMERHSLRGAEAFELMSTASQHSNRKLTDIAHDLIKSVESPTTGGAGPSVVRDSDSER